MPRPRITPAFNWSKFEQSVLDVFSEALNRLASEPSLPQGEEPINLVLYWKCRQVHLEFMQAQKSLPFYIQFNTTNQPQPDDTVRSQHLLKRPDFACTLTNPQAADFSKTQVSYTIECKRLGTATGKWIFTENYSEHGMLRFRQSAHSYAKGATSAAMIGYAQSMPDDDLLQEVNAHAAARTVPSLSRAATAWATKGVSVLDQDPLTRQFDPNPIQLRHLWLDLRQMTFIPPPPKPKTPKKITGKVAKKKKRGSKGDTRH